MVTMTKGSMRHAEVFQMDGVEISIIERPRPLHNHDTPNATHHTYTLKYEEPNFGSQPTGVDHRPLPRKDGQGVGHRERPERFPARAGPPGRGRRPDQAPGDGLYAHPGAPGDPLYPEHPGGAHKQLTRPNCRNRRNNSQKLKSKATELR